MDPLERDFLINVQDIDDFLYRMLFFQRNVSELFMALLKHKIRELFLYNYPKDTYMSTKSGKIIKLSLINKHPTKINGLKISYLLLHNSRSTLWMIGQDQIKLIGFNRPF